MITKPPHRFDAQIGADGLELFPQEAHIDLHMVFHRVGVIAPDPLQEGLLGDIAAPGLQQKPHHVKFPGGQADALLPAPEDPGGEVQLRVSIAQLVHLFALPAQQRVDAGDQLPAVEGLGQVIVGAGIQALHPVQKIGLRGEHQNRHGAVLAA